MTRRKTCPLRKKEMRKMFHFDPSVRNPHPPVTPYRGLQGVEG